MSSEQKHVKEPWFVSQWREGRWHVVDTAPLVSEDCGVIATCYTEEDALRIALCVNALAGVPDEILRHAGLGGLTETVMAPAMRKLLRMLKGGQQASGGNGDD